MTNSKESLNQCPACRHDKNREVDGMLKCYQCGCCWYERSGHYTHTGLRDQVRDLIYAEGLTSGERADRIIALFAHPAPAQSLVEAVARAMALNAGDESEWDLWLDEAQLAVSIISARRAPDASTLKQWLLDYGRVRHNEDASAVLCLSLNELLEAAHQEATKPAAEGLVDELRELRNTIFYWMTRNVQTPEGAVKILGQVKESLTEIIVKHEPPTTGGNLQPTEANRD